MTFMFSFYNGPALAQTSSYEELQAAYIFNFAKYIKWPCEASTFMIGIYGEQGIVSVFQNALEGKKIGGKAIELKIITSIEETLQCSIVYVSESGSKAIYALVSKIAGKNILIVTEEDLIKKGASISFVVEEDRLRFKLKRKALSDAGLVASEGLLKLAIKL